MAEMKVSVTWKIGGRDPSTWERLKDARIPSPFTATFQDPEAHVVELDVEIEDESPICTGIRIERNKKRPPLSGAEIRRLPLRDWVAFAVGQVALMPREGPPGVATFSPPNDEEAWGISRAADRAPRRRKITDDLLKEVAKTYRANIEDAPRDAVMEVFGVKAAMASRYIKLARERGFLGTATKGKAGER